MEGIDKIMERLYDGEVLMIDDQMRSYINIEDDDKLKRFVVRSIYASVEDAAIALDQQSLVKYEERQFSSLAEALLSLTDWEWRKRGQAKEINGCEDCHCTPCACDDWQADLAAQEAASNEPD